VLLQIKYEYEETLDWEIFSTFIKILRHEKSDSKQKYILNNWKESLYYDKIYNTTREMINKLRQLQNDSPNFDSNFQSNEIEGNFSYYSD
jgi:hypothetical protein